MEIWKDIVGYEGLYQISNLGQARRLTTTILVNRKDTPHTRLVQGRLLNPIIMSGRKGSNNVYETVGLCKNGVLKFVAIHRLVAMAFVEGCSEENCVVDHINHDQRDNRAANLRWVTPKENSNNRK